MVDFTGFFTLGHIFTAHVTGNIVLAAVAHCPGNYCRLELEEAETGRPLTASADRKPQWLPRPHPKRMASRVTLDRVFVRADWLSTI
jgi:hypothetical protein